jgi:nucleoside-diphosphate-sugar epimerase
MTAMTLPAIIRDIAHLEELLSEPTLAAVAALGKLEGDLLVLGVGGKMGPTLARMARRAFDQAKVKRRVIGVARFSDPKVEAKLNGHGVETVRADLLAPAQLEALPDAANVVYMAGMKFGTTGQAPLTWAMNVLLPAMVCRRFAKSRIVAFSTGNVYGLTPATRGGSREEDSLEPVGEYAMTALGRERILEHFSRTLGIPAAILRLNYAVEMRYGVLVDVARRVHAGEPIALDMGCYNAIWQGDANAMALAAFDRVASPPTVLNLAGPETLSVRQVAEEFGRLFEKPVRFTGSEASDALLSNGQRAIRLFGYPRVDAGRMIEWIADWVGKGGESLGKPTHFENRRGDF